MTYSEGRKKIVKRVKKVTIGTVATGVIIAAIMGGCNILKDLNHSNDKDKNIDNTNKTSSTTTIDEATKYRTNTLDKIYKFANSINSDNALVVNNQKLMFTFDEAVGLYIYFNYEDLSVSDLSNLFGDYPAKYEEIKKGYQSALLKLRIYNRKTVVESGLDSIMLNEKSQSKIKEYEQNNISYNKTGKGASGIIGNFDRDFVKGSDLPYESINSGVSRMLITSFATMYEMSFYDEPVYFSKITKKCLSDIETTLCDRTNNSVKKLVDDLNVLQAINVKTSTTDESQELTSYEELREFYISKLKKDGNYPLSNTTIDLEPNYFYDNSKAFKSTSKGTSSSNSSSSKGTKKVTDKGSNLTQKQIEEKINSLPDELKDDANSQIKEIQDKTDKENKEKEEYARGLEAAGKDKTDYYNAYNAALKGLDKPIYYNYPASASSYEKGYIDGKNKQIDNGYAGGKAELEAAKEIEEQDKKDGIIDPSKPTSTPTPTPSASVSKSSYQPNSLSTAAKIQLLKSAKSELYRAHIEAVMSKNSKGYVKTL